MRVDALSALPTIGSPVLTSAEPGDQNFFNKNFKRERKDSKRKREGRREDKRKLREAQLSNFSTLN